MVVQRCSQGGRAAPGHRPQLHPLCWITYSASCSLPTPLLIQVCNLPRATSAGESREAGLFPWIQKKANREKVN